MITQTHPGREAGASADALSQKLRALAHPARLRILAALAANNACQCGDIVRGLPLAQSTVSEHLRILCEAGLVRGETTGGRPCYCLDRAAVQKLAGEFDRLLAAITHQRAPPLRRGARKGADKAAERN
ncbi:MAG: metalloregulator ArsR/SmtB family transcription factor [Xanthobacteraceae bacterium]